ncbi:GNAT family N-acetyltransferase [Breznakiella homolactica]|uniref:GNAT family N-acetyltransferase n=1 Tax=Breznakiella homolactica TaxID=2798577 RepID=A0A7T7XPZ6_9SPIR|nr:GNAT family N-acetyltransferase [Breznakiella homolactica]QQO10252.1 GNAT family N-acetyltransferase [Breznakiella homolactica]
MDIRIERLDEQDINRFSDLVNTVFDRFVGPDYSDAGNRTFKEYTDPARMVQRLRAGGDFFAAWDGETLAGALEIRDQDHVSLFFVDERYHGRGVGRKLFSYYTGLLRREHPGIRQVTVNSSLYAEPVYAALGFEKTGEAMERDGIRFIPMEYNL